MSDDELPMTGEGMGDLQMADMENMEGMSDGEEEVDLPEGVKKEIIQEAPEGNYNLPKTGDEVTVHYVGTLQSDGSQFDSSRSREQPFKFTLGQGEVIKGWDLGVATMKKGEVAKFTLSPEYAYGDAGSPPSIPEKATLVFEVELIDWLSKDDLFSDGGVIKLQLTEGSGWKSPQDGEVKISLKASQLNGDLIDDKGSFEYVMGSDQLGPLATTQATDGHGQPIPSFIAESLSFTAGNGAVCDALEFAVQQMKKGERAVVTSAAHLCREPKLGLAEVEAEKVILTMELMDFEELKGTWEMSQEEKLEHGAARKDVGAELFKSKRYRLALQCYKRVADLFGYIDNYKEENKAKEGQSLSQHILWLMFHLKGEEPDSDLGARGKRCFLSPFLSLFVLGRGDEDGLHSEPGGVRVEVGALRRGQAELRYRAEASGQSRESALPPCSG
eukprot:g4510.t1